MAAFYGNRIRAGLMSVEESYGYSRIRKIKKMR